MGTVAAHASFYYNSSPLSNYTTPFKTIRFVSPTVFLRYFPFGTKCVTCDEERVQRIISLVQDKHCFTVSSSTEQMWSCVVLTPLSYLLLRTGLMGVAVGWSAEQSFGSYNGWNQEVRSHQRREEAYQDTAA